MGRAESPRQLGLQKQSHGLRRWSIACAGAAALRRLAALKACESSCCCWPCSAANGQSKVPARPEARRPSVARAGWVYARLQTCTGLPMVVSVCRPRSAQLLAQQQASCELASTHNFSGASGTLPSGIGRDSVVPRCCRSSPFAPHGCLVACNSMCCGVLKLLTIVCADLGPRFASCSADHEIGFCNSLGERMLLKHVILGATWYSLMLRARPSSRQVAWQVLGNRSADKACPKGQMSACVRSRAVCPHDWPPRWLPPPPQHLASCICDGALWKCRPVEVCSHAHAGQPCAEC